MPYVPMQVHGKTRIIFLKGEADSEETSELLIEQDRKVGVQRRRQFYDGEQYDEANRLRAKACSIDDMDLLPEHERLHNYSTHISECIDFVSDQLSSGFTCTIKNDAERTVIHDCYAGTSILSSDDKDAAVEVDHVLNDGLQAGDVAYEVKWDPIHGQVYLDVWESEYVQFLNPYGDHVSKVVRRELIWVDDPTSTDSPPARMQIEEKVEYGLQLNDFGIMECRKDTYWPEDEGPREMEWLGLPIIPWGVLRVRKSGLRSFRGESFITEQVMDAVKRFDAIEQVAYLIARYNSHGNLVVVGDGASLSIEASGGVHKDVADVLTFPGGTNAFTIELPTDPQMIEHQRQVLAEAIYKKFGLTRVEPDTLQYLGAVSGYALEILNRKSQGTLGRISRQWSQDWVAMNNRILDVYAYRESAKFVVGNALGEPEELDLDDPELVIPEDAILGFAFWDVDPQAVFATREFEIEMGTGYIVDEVAIRDDFTANLISQQEALKKKGYEPTEITQIMNDQKEKSSQEAQIAQRALGLLSDQNDAESGGSGGSGSRVASTAADNS